MTGRIPKIETLKQSRPGQMVRYLCGKFLPDDMREWCLAISNDEMQKLGLMDDSEIREGDPVFVKLCLACGFEQGASTGQEIHDAEVQAELKN